MSRKHYNIQVFRDAERHTQLCGLEPRSGVARFGRRIAEIRQEIQAVLLPSKLAEELGAEAGTAALKIIRRYVDPAGETFEISVTIHPAERFAFMIRLQRERE
jgi:GntR family transcriptional regulator